MLQSDIRIYLTDDKRAFLIPNTIDKIFPADAIGLVPQRTIDAIESMFGYANCYVRVPEDHPYYGLDMEQANEVLSAHGGITYTGLDEDGWWILGFDTGHWGDKVRCTEEWCKRETMDLYQQTLEIKYLPIQQENNEKTESTIRTSPQGDSSNAQIN